MAAGLLSVVTLTSCSGSDRTTGTADSEATASSSSTPAAGGRRQASTAATGFLRTWSQPDLTTAEWWRQVAPLLDARGRQDYTGTDPANIPALRVTGPGRQVRSQPTYAVVAVPTTIGDFNVHLTRTTDPDAAWFVDVMDFPPGVH